MKNHKSIKVTELNDRLFIDLYVDRAPIGVMIFMGIFALIGCLIPIVTIIFSNNQNLDIGPGFIISLIIGFGVSFYLTRIILWNTVGVEKYVISKKSVKQTCDYKWFKDSERMLKGNDILSKYVSQNSKPDESGRLTFETTNENIQSVIDLPIENLKDLLRIIEIKLDTSSK